MAAERLRSFFMSSWIYAYKICYVNYPRWITVEKFVPSALLRSNRLAELRLRFGVKKAL